MKIKRNCFYYILRPLLKCFFCFFFDKKYLVGKYFDYSLFGWNKCWKCLFTQKILGYNKRVQWPVSPFIAIDNPRSIYFHPDDMNNFWHHGCYYANCEGGKIVIGKGTWIAPNVGIITTNHDFNDLNKHLIPQDVIIGDRCWLGMNSLILPGVNIANGTIVGAGTVVTKSVTEENSILVGNPARIIKKY